jgi:hypothetical protein
MTPNEAMTKIRQMADEYMAALDIKDEHMRLMVRSAYVTGMMQICNVIAENS